MRYIARSEMRVAGHDGLMRTIHPGEPVPEFASWPYVLRIAHLENATVEEVGGQYNANLSFANGRLTYDGREMAPLELVDHVAEPPADVTPEGAESVEVEVEAATVTPAGTFPCTVCDKVFYRPSRLKSHMLKHN